MRVLSTQKNIFDMPSKQGMAVCVTTNGVVKKDFTAVMGAGQAKEANQRYNCAGKLGKYLLQYGNRVFNLGTVSTSDGCAYQLISFPTKHSWRDKSDLGLIVQSAYQLKELTTKLGLKQVYLPPVGCGLGGLNWEQQVAPVLQNILDNRFCVVLRTVRG